LKTILTYVFKAFSYAFATLITVATVMIGSVTLGHNIMDYYKLDDMIGVGISFFLFILVMSIIISLTDR
jgi:uncharacterized membrane protein YccC